MFKVKAELFSVGWGWGDVILMLQCAQWQCPSPVGSVAPVQVRALNLSKSHKKIHSICVPRYINNYFSWKSFPQAVSPSALQTVSKKLGQKNALFFVRMSSRNKQTWRNDESRAHCKSSLVLAMILCFSGCQTMVTIPFHFGQLILQRFIRSHKFTTKQMEQLLNKEKHKFMSSKRPRRQIHHILMLSLT